MKIVAVDVMIIEAEAPANRPAAVLFIAASIRMREFTATVRPAL